MKCCPAIEDAASGGEVQERFRGDELKPCPFCGGEALMLKDHHKLGIYVACTSCHCCTETTDKDKALAAWNTRAALKARGD